MSGLTVRDDFERLVVDWLDDTAGSAAPAYLGETLTRIEGVRQRPAWMSPGRWLPMRALTLQRFNVPRFVPLLVTLALLVVLAIVVAILVGSRNEKLPPPFGLATPGWLVLDAGEELVRIDPDGATVLGFATLPHRQFGATWSRDGRHVAYWSATGPVEVAGGVATPATLWVANGDGGSPRAVLGDRRFETYELFPAVSWSPNSRRLAFFTTKGELWVVDADGSNLLQIGGDAIGRCCPAWSPDGSLIAFNGMAGSTNVALPGALRDVYVVNPDGTGEVKVSRSLTALPNVDWSADGRLTYTVGSGDIAVATRGPSGWTETIIVEANGSENFFTRWSNAGDRIAYVRQTGLWLVDGDGSNPRQLPTKDWVNIAWPCWSPDDRTIVVFHTDGPNQFVEYEDSASALFINAETGEQLAEVPVPGISGILACSWQRLAP